MGQFQQQYTLYIMQQLYANFHTATVLSTRVLSISALSTSALGTSVLNLGVVLGIIELLCRVDFVNTRCTFFKP